MNLLITGGCGFIGSNYINHVFNTINIQNIVNIVNIDVLNYCASEENLSHDARNHRNYKFIKGNINNIDLVKHILKEEQISHIIHFAAQSHVDNSFDNSLMYTEDNVRGTHCLLEAIRTSNKDIVFLHFSTDEVYGESLHTDMSSDAKRETSLLLPTNPYAASKAASEMYVNAYRHSYGLKTIISRCNNVYGPNQYPEKLIPKFIKHLKENKKCTIHGDGSSLRSFIHVNDVCFAVDLILQKGIIGEIYNIGSDEENEISVIDVTKTLVSLIKPTCRNATEWIEYVKDRPFNDKRYFINCDKLKEMGWKQTISFKDGINSLVFEDVCTIRKNCRICNSKRIEEVLSLEPTPPANSFYSSINQQIAYMPLSVGLCNECSHIQLMQIVNPSKLYENYLYVSSTSHTMVNHLETHVLNFIETNNINKQDNVLEIGSNDGVCVKYLLENGYSNVVGIDPAKNINNTHNLPIICDYFGSNMYSYFNDKYGQFKLIFGFHCCAHIESIQDVFDTIFKLLTDDGLFVMEVGYFYDVFKNNTFDTIYHEHIDYYTVTAMNNYCKLHNLCLVNVKQTTIQGGSIQFFIQKYTPHTIQSDNIRRLIDCEQKLNIFNTSVLKQWFNNIQTNGEELIKLLKKIKTQNKKIVGYGASAKSTTFIHQFKLNNSIIDYIIDDNEYKINKHTPGSNIIIKSINEIKTNTPDVILILSWNFAEELTRKINEYVIKNNLSPIKIIIPFPILTII